MNGFNEIFGIDNGLEELIKSGIMEVCVLPCSLQFISFLLLLQFFLFKLAFFRSSSQTGRLNQMRTFAGYLLYDRYSYCHPNRQYQRTEVNALISCWYN